MNSWSGGSGSFQAQSMSVTNQNGDVVLQTGQVEDSLSVDGGPAMRIGAVRRRDHRPDQQRKLELAGAGAPAIGTVLATSSATAWPGCR
jgi:hypothetical protein